MKNNVKAQSKMKKEIFRSEKPDGDWLEDFKHENGNYQNQCHKCGNLFMGYKRRVTCKACVHPLNPADPVLDFTSVFHYVRSVQKYSGMTNAEAGALYHIFEMWENKRYFEPIEYKLMGYPIEEDDFKQGAHEKDLL